MIGTVRLASALPVISGDLTLDGANAVTVEGGNGLNDRNGVHVLHVASGASLAVEARTITHGYAEDSRGGCVLNEGDLALDETTVRGCVVSENGAGSGNYNLIDGPCGSAQSLLEPVTGFDPTLSQHGGPTATHALLPGSNAIDAGADGCPGLDGTPLPSEQRGLTRPVDGDADGTARCDIGAYERQWQWLFPLLPMSAGTAAVRSERFSADRVHPRIPKSPLRSLRYQAGHTRHLPLAQH